MIKAVIIGSGNVAQHLALALIESNEIDLLQWYARDESQLLPFADRVAVTNDLNQLTNVDLYLIAVSDDAIADVSNKLSFQNRLVVHTSGSVSLNAISDVNRAGVFYPLQTFSKNKSVNFKNIPICLEASNADDFELLEKVANAISNSVYAINSEQRSALHLAAVFANNFTNHLYGIADTICAEHSISFDILKPLIRETADKVMTLSPKEAQTGPAKRNDKKTIERHLSQLKDQNQKDIYTLITQSIQHEQEL